MATELNTFVKQALEKGQTKEEIKTVLLKARWRPEEVQAALDIYADINFPVAVPQRKPYLSAREAFMYLLLFLTLYISAVSFGTLLFQFTNFWLPDPLGDYDNWREPMRTGLASIIVAFPIYLWMSVLLGRSIKKDPDKRGSKIRKWLTYITLFIAAGIIIGDLIALLTSLFGGELTLRFIIKVMVVLSIAGTIFSYYLLDLRKEEKNN